MLIKKKKHNRNFTHTVKIKRDQSKKKIKDYVIEIIIFLLSVIIALVGLFIVDWQYAVLVFIIIQSSNIGIISIKHYIDIVIGEKQDETNDLIISLFDDGFNFKDIIVDSKWKKLKESTRNVYFKRISGLYKGKIELAGEELFYYQNELIQHTQKQIWAIHIADTENSLKLWDPLRREDSKFKKASYYACKELSEGVEKRRLFFIHKDKIKLDESKEFLKLFERVILDQQNILGFSVRYLFIEEVAKQLNIPFDKIICDAKEVIEVQMREGRVNLALAYIEPRLVEESINEFNNLWNMADDWEKQPLEQSETSNSKREGISP